MTMNFNDKFFLIQPMAVSKLRYGFYFVRVASDDGIINRTFKIEKM